MPDVDQALSEAHIVAGKAHMHTVATLAQNYQPDATVVILSQSDQGENLSVSGFIVPGVNEADNPDVAYDFDDDGEAMCLYTDVYVMRELYAQYDVRGDIEYSDRMGLRSFHMDIAKVLAELGPEPMGPPPCNAYHTDGPHPSDICGLPSDHWPAPHSWEAPPADPPWPATDEDRVRLVEWMTDVDEGNTVLGFRDWVANQKEV